MLVVDGRLELNRGPRENWSRPAVDPLLRSAALWYGADAIGIILTGRLNDGTSGLYEIKRHGGVAVVQTPSEAEAPGMPQSALDNVAIDYCLPVAEMPRLLTRLTAEPKQRREIAGDRAMPQDNRIVQPSAQTCPECGGAMREETTGSFKKYRCHIGHVMTAEILAAAQLETLENTLSTSLRLLNERAALCRDIAERHLANGNRRAGDVWKRAADEAAHREERAKEMVQAGWAHPEAAEAES